MIHFILMQHLKVRNIFARWGSTDEQNRQRVKVTKKLLQMSQTCDKNSLPMSSPVMIIGSIILSRSERLAIKSGLLKKSDAQ